MSRTSIKLSKSEVDDLLSDQGVILDQPHVEGKTFRALFQDSQGLPFFSTVSALLYQPRKNYASGASAAWLKEKQKLKARINELEVTVIELEDTIAVLKEEW